MTNILHITAYPGSLGLGYTVTHTQDPKTYRIVAMSYRGVIIAERPARPSRGYRRHVRRVKADRRKH